jgi:hypothetical protein
MGLLALGVLGRFLWPLVQAVSAVFFSFAGV